MKIIAGLLIAGMIGFALFSAAREVKAYNRYLRGDVQYLVSKARRNRRLLISASLVSSATFLFLGLFVLTFENPARTLLFWLFPLALTLLTMYLSVLDFKETSRDLDRISRDATEAVARKIFEDKLKMRGPHA